MPEKVKRAAFTKNDKYILNSEYDKEIGVSNYPSDERRQELAKSLRKPVSQITNWFKNERAKRGHSKNWVRPTTRKGRKRSSRLMDEDASSYSIIDSSSMSSFCSGTLLIDESATNETMNSSHSEVIPEPKKRKIEPQTSMIITDVKQENLANLLSPRKSPLFSISTPRHNLSLKDLFAPSPLTPFPPAPSVTEKLQTSMIITDVKQENLASLQSPTKLPLVSPRHNLPKKLVASGAPSTPDKLQLPSPAAMTGSCLVAAKKQGDIPQISDVLSVIKGILSPAPLTVHDAPVSVPEAPVVAPEAPTVPPPEATSSSSSDSGEDAIEINVDKISESEPSEHSDEENAVPALLDENIRPFLSFPQQSITEVINYFPIAGCTNGAYGKKTTRYEYFYPNVPAWRPFSYFPFNSVPYYPSF